MRALIDGLTSSTLGTRTTKDTGAKSLAVSYGICEYRTWLIACVPGVPIRNV